jgi:adenylate cyclase
MALSDAERAKLYRDRHRAPIEPRACSECGKRFTPARKDGVTCSPTCRKRRQRRLAKEDAISSSRRFDSDFELRHRSGAGATATLETTEPGPTTWRTLEQQFTLHDGMLRTRLRGVEPSEEIRRIVERWIRAISERDSESSLGRASEHPGAVMIGTDPDEWFHGSEARAIWARQLEEMDSFSVIGIEIEAWEEGTVGWASVKEKMSWDDEEAQARATYVFHLEQGEWKAVQIHRSLPMGNVDLYGKELTVSIDALERSIERERPDLFATLAVDGTVTIVFTDIVDSTVLTSRLGDHAWRDVLRRHDTLIRDVTGAHGGTVVETQGDGSMLAFSSARRAVGCAQAVQRAIATTFADDSPPIRIRIGIHTGDAIQEADRFFGTTVHFAARVASQALGGEVLVSNLVRELVANAGIKFTESREVELKGLDGTYQLFAVDLTDQ